MSLRNTPQAAAIRLADYTSPDWRVERVELEFDLAIERTEVLARLHLRREGDAPLLLDGENLQLLSIHLDQRELGAHEWHYAEGVLSVPGARDGSVLETRVALNPADNTALEGLYLSGPAATGFLLTQCEAQGFRHITFFPDRPDVQARFTVTLRADRARFPVLLAGGNADGAGQLADGRHWARFVDPHPKPSYLFALVAGKLEKISRDYTTADDRAVTLNLWAEPNAIDSCGYAMDALQRAMRWDEQAYGRNYDLDVFHVVATQDFNMGAMENKGLNIFNAKCLLASPETTTDIEYRHVEAVVAHEYFHNWSGNRVTCRDWFQLSLKEGLTVYREQSFSADMHSAPIKRIEDVSMLRRAQFSEDAGPLAHPVRPSEYREINNFYTATVYEKGAELVRMLAGRLGKEGFRRGMDRYFERHDGDAATIEDFVAALGDANQLDLTPYLAWYAQSGTPRLQAVGAFDAHARRYLLTLSQHTPATPDQADAKAPLPMPVALALFDTKGDMLPLRLADEAAAMGTERVIELDTASQTFVFEDIDAAPIPSLLRGLSAPVILECSYTPPQWALLLRHDADGYNRWEAGQQLATRAFDDLHGMHPDSLALCAWCDTLADLFDVPDIDPALLAELLTPPSETELGERHLALDPEAVHAARERLLRALARRLGVDAMRERHATLATDAALDGSAQANRRLRQALLDLLARVDADAASSTAHDQYHNAVNMTERLGALRCLLRLGAADATSADFRQRFDGAPLVLDKWFSAHAQVPGEAALAHVKMLLADPAFTLRNPNRARAVLGSYAQNPSGFHRADGAGYRLLVDQLAALDALNPQVSARVATAFNGWNRLEPQRREAAHAAIASLAARPDLSRDLSDILERVLRA